MEASSADHEAVLKGWFESFDPNGRGHVKSDDVLSVMGSSFSSDELAKVVEKLDKDDDGMITWDEFKDAFLALIDFPGVDDVDMHAVDNQPTVRASENQNGPQDVAGRHTSRRSRRTRTSIDNPLLNGFLHEAQAARSLRSLREDGVDDESEASSHAGTEVQSRRSSMISIGQQSSVISKQNSVARMASGRVGEHVHELVERCLLAEGKRDQVDQANRQLQRQVDMLQRELERKNVSDGEELHRKIAELDQALRTAKESLSREIDRAVLAEKTMEDMEKQLTEVQSQLEQVTSEKDELATEVEQYTAMLDGMQHEEGDEFGRTYSCPANMPGTTRQFKPGRSRAGSLQEQFIECHPISEEPTDDGLCWQAGFGALDGERLSEVDIASSIAAESNEGAEATEDPEVLRLRTELSGHKLWMEDMEQVIEGLRNTEEKQGVELSQLRKRQQEERERADALQMSLADANKRIEDAETAGRASLSDLCGCLAEERERANALQASLENANQRIEEAEAAGRAALSDACTCLKEERDGRKVPNSVENGGYSTELTSFVLTSDMGSTVDIVGKDTGHRGRLEVCDLKDRMATLLGKVRWRHDGLGDVFSSWARVSEHVGSAVSTKDSVSSRSAIATTEAHPACSSVDTDASVHDCGSPTAETSRLNDRSLRALDVCLQVQQRRCALDFAFMLWEKSRMEPMNGVLENRAAEMTQAHPTCSSVDADASVHDCGSPTAESSRLNDRSLRALDGCLQVQQRRCALDFAFMLWEKSRMEPMNGALKNSAAEMTQAHPACSSVDNDASAHDCGSPTAETSRLNNKSLRALDLCLQVQQRRCALDFAFMLWEHNRMGAMNGALENSGAEMTQAHPACSSVDTDAFVHDCGSPTAEALRLNDRSLRALDGCLQVQQRRCALDFAFMLWEKSRMEPMKGALENSAAEITQATSGSADLGHDDAERGRVKSEVVSVSRRSTWSLPALDSFLEARQRRNLLDGVFVFWTQILFELAMQGPLRIADVGPRDVEQDVVDSERARVSSRSTWSLPALDLFLEAQQRRHLLEGVFLLWTRDLCQAMMLDTTLDPRQTEPPEISAAGYCGMVASKEAGLADVLLNQDFTDSQLARASTRKLCPLSGWETFLEAQRAYNILDCAFALWTRIYLETKVVAVENARETKAETRHNDLKMMVVNALWRTRAEQNATFITFMFWGRYSSNEKLQASLQCSEELRQLTGRLNTVFDEELKAISNSVQGVLDSGYGNGAVVTMFDKANSEQLICGCFIMWERAARVSRRRVSFMSDKGSIATSQNGEEKTAERENSHANVLALKSECWRLKRRWASSLDVPKLEIRRLKNKESSALKELASVINGRKSTRSSSFFDKTLLQGKSGHARRSC